MKFVFMSLIMGLTCFAISSKTPPARLSRAQIIQMNLAKEVQRLSHIYGIQPTGKSLKETQEHNEYLRAQIRNIQLHIKSNQLAKSRPLNNTQGSEELKSALQEPANESFQQAKAKTLQNIK